MNHSLILYAPTILRIFHFALNFLVKFREQNQGVLSKRAKEKEFSKLNGREIEQIENVYITIFQN